MPFLLPAFAAVSAFASTALGSILVNAAIGVGLSLLSSALAPKAAQAATPKPTGMRLSVAMGDTLPLSFPVGYVGTAGSKKYSMSWGNSGDVPNAFVTEVFQISDIPSPGLDGFWANKQRCTILWGDTPTAQGYPVSEFRVGGVDHVWVKFRTGLETTADSFLVGTFGSHPQYPWTSAFIGRGAPHAIVTTLYNRELFTSVPACLFEPTPTKFYDLRKDSTNGGSGSHRWNDQSTWESTTNPVVIIYNVIRGVYYGTTWIYGGRNLPAFRLPASSWIAAANECDAPRNLAGGGTEPQFRCGIEINVNVEPLSMIEELLKACSGRMSEIGGIFEILVGAPGAAVYSFTDDNIMISRGQKYSSFPGLSNTHNAIEATYPEPGELWASKSAPARFNATYEAEDGGRRLATGLSLNAVPYGVQAQQLMATMIEDDRRWRTHWLTLPPDAWILTGTCVVNWSSVRNGYTNKKFLVVQADGEPGMSQSVVLREIDPTDYGWTSAQQLPNPIGNLVIVRPSAQVVTGFQVFPAILYDDDGDARRPSIEVVYDGNMPDIRSVHVLVRLKSSGAYVFDGEIPFAVPYRNVLNGVFLPLTTYEVAVKYMPFSGRPTEFTAYLEVTTDNVKFMSGKDFDPYGDIDLDAINDDFKGLLTWIGTNTREIIRQAQELATKSADDVLQSYSDRQIIRTQLASVTQDVTASYSNAIVVATGPGSAIVSRIEDLEVTVNDTYASAISLLQTQVVTLDGAVTATADSITALDATVDRFSASGRLRASVVATESGATTTIGFYAEATDSSTTSTAAMFISATTGGSGSRVSFETDAFVIKTPGGLKNLLYWDGTALRVDTQYVKELTAANIAANSITSDRINVSELLASSAFISNLTVTNANITDLTVTRIKIADGAVHDFPTVSGSEGSIPNAVVKTYYGGSFTAPPGPFMIALSISITKASDQAGDCQVGIFDTVTSGLTILGSGSSGASFSGVAGPLVSGRTYEFYFKATANKSGGGPDWTVNGYSGTATVPRK